MIVTEMSLKDAFGYLDNIIKDPSEVIKIPPNTKPECPHCKFIEKGMSKKDIVLFLIGMIIGFIIYTTIYLIISVRV